MGCVEINIFLFGKHEWEFSGDINPKSIQKKGDELKERLFFDFRKFTKTFK